MNKDLRLGLQGKLLFPIVVTILFLIGGSAFFIARFVTERMEEDLVSMLSAGNDILIKNIHSTVKAYKGVLRSIAAYPNLRELVGKKTREDEVYQKAQAMMDSLSFTFPEFLQFNLTDSDGTVFLSSNRESVGTVNIADRKYFVEAMNGLESLSEPLTSKSTGQKAIIVASPVRDLSDTVKGVLYAIVPCSLIVRDTIRDVRMAKTGYAYIVDGSSGLMLAHNIQDKIGTMDMFSYQPWMKGLDLDERGVKKDYLDSSGAPRFAVFHKEPVSGWIAVSCVTTAEVQSQESFLRNVILALSLGAAVLVGLIVCYHIRRVTKDIFIANEFAQKVAGGDLKRILTMHRDDELGDLGDALRVMVHSLQDFVAKEIRMTEERRKSLIAMRDAMMLTLADLVESRDSCTGQHIRKTAAYVDIIVKELQKEGKFPESITDEFIDNVVRSAPLHDIGKINVPDAVLNKPGKLTDEEFSVIKKHAVAGGKIITKIIEVTPDSDFLNEAKNLAEFHHERWDGRGYPAGLAGENIPLSARIMAVADVFDALVSDRSYKKGFPPEKAFAIILEERGTHFDPCVVDAFFAVKEKILAVRNQFIA